MCCPMPLVFVPNSAHSKPKTFAPYIYFSLEEFTFTTKLKSQLHSANYRLYQCIKHVMSYFNRLPSSTNSPHVSNQTVSEPSAVTAMKQHEKKYEPE